MNVFAFVISGVLFLGSFLLFGYSFTVEAGPISSVMFASGIIAVALALAIPFHLLGDSEQY